LIGKEPMLKESPEIAITTEERELKAKENIENEIVLLKMKVNMLEEALKWRDKVIEILEEKRKQDRERQDI